MLAQNSSTFRAAGDLLAVILLLPEVEARRPTPAAKAEGAAAAVMLRWKFFDVALSFFLF